MASEFPEAAVDSLCRTLSRFLPVPSCLQNADFLISGYSEPRADCGAGREIRRGRAKPAARSAGWLSQGFWVVPALAEAGDLHTACHQGLGCPWLSMKKPPWVSLEKGTC